MTVGCMSVEESTLIGLVGIDISLLDLTDTITHTNKQGVYAFLVDVHGECGALSSPQVSGPLGGLFTGTVLCFYSSTESLPNIYYWTFIHSKATAYAHMLLVTLNFTSE